MQAALPCSVSEHPQVCGQRSKLSMVADGVRCLKFSIAELAGVWLCSGWLRHARLCCNLEFRPSFSRNSGFRRAVAVDGGQDNR